MAPCHRKPVLVVGPQELPVLVLELRVIVSDAPKQVLHRPFLQATYRCPRQLDLNLISALFQGSNPSPETLPVCAFSSLLLREGSTEFAERHPSDRPQPSLRDAPAGPAPSRKESLGGKYTRRCQFESLTAERTFEGGWT